MLRALLSHVDVPAHVTARADGRPLGARRRVSGSNTLALDNKASPRGSQRLTSLTCLVWLSWPELLTSLTCQTLMDRLLTPSPNNRVPRLWDDCRHPPSDPVVRTLANAPFCPSGEAPIPAVQLTPIEGGKSSEMPTRSSLTRGPLASFHLPCTLYEHRSHIAQQDLARESTLKTLAAKRCASPIAHRDECRSFSLSRKALAFWRAACAELG